MNTVRSLVGGLAVASFFIFQIGHKYLFLWLAVLLGIGFVVLMVSGRTVK